MKEKKLRGPCKAVKSILLLIGIVLAISPIATTQERRPPPGDLEVKALLRVRPLFQGNCSPLNFRVTNSGGTDSGAFSIAIYKGSRAQMTAETHADEIAVENIKGKESRSFEWSNNLNGLYTVSLRARGRVAKAADAIIEVETRCIK